MIPEDPDYEQAKDALHDACIPKADELWFVTDRVCVVYIRSLSSSPAWPHATKGTWPAATRCDGIWIHVYEQIGKPNTGGGFAFMSRHYALDVWRFLWVKGTLRRITEKEAIHFIGSASLAEMRNRTEHLKRQAEMRA